jgi:hypothetical protein
MSQLSSFICESIQAGQSEAFLGAHEVILAYRSPSTDGGGVEPWASRILAESPTDADIDEIRNTLLDALENGNDTAVAGAAFALAAFQDDALIPSLRAQLRRQVASLKRAHYAVSSLLTALAHSGDEAQNAAFLGLSDPTRSLATAEEYLAKFTRRLRSDA